MDVDGTKEGSEETLNRRIGFPALAGIVMKNMTLALGGRFCCEEKLRIGRGLLMLEVFF